MNPVALLALAAALFAAPAVYLLVASLVSHQGALPSATLPRSAEITIWSVGVAALVVPFTISRLMASSPDSVRLLIALVISVAASVVGLTLTLVTGEAVPVRILAPASMIAVLGWSRAYRSCFRANPLMHVVSRYTTVLVVVAAFSLVWAAFRLAFWERAVDSDIGPGPDGFMIFLEGSVGIAGLAVAHLRRSASPYARPATQVLSVIFFFVLPLGFLAALYWLFRVRPRELQSSRSTPAGSQGS